MGAVIVCQNYKILAGYPAPPTPACRCMNAMKDKNYLNYAGKEATEFHDTD